MPRTRALGGVVLLLALGLTGCGGPHFVDQDQYGGVVAIPSNTNYWPTRYRSRAEEMMFLKCPQGYIIEYEDEDYRVAAKDGTHRLLTHEKKEYWISFRAKAATSSAVPEPPQAFTPSSHAISVSHLPECDQCRE